MDFREYQRISRQTATYPAGSLEYVFLGLCSEAGEAAGKRKKIIRDANNVMNEEAKEAIAQELGDCLWYVAQICTEIGLDMQDVAEGNLQKLLSRQERGVIQGSGDDR